MLFCLLMICALSSCGNKAYISIGELEFKHIHISDNINGYCATVTKWWDNDQGIEVKTAEFGSLFCSEGSYILFSDETKCPYCN